MLIEKLAYHVGEVACDLVFISLGGQFGMMAVAKVKFVAKAYALVDKSPTAITNNIFECLEFVNY